jgi:hypothetical protein
VAEQDVHYVLDERFDSFLDQDHREFKEKMLHLLQDLSATCRSTPVYHRLEGFLRRHLGYDSLSFWQAANLESGKARIHSSSPTKDVPMKSETSNPGHVFCINGSVCDLSCDAFVCPAAIGRKSGQLTGTIRSMEATADRFLPRATGLFGVTRWFQEGIQTKQEISLETIR